MSATLSPAPGISIPSRARNSLPATLRRSVAGLVAWAGPKGYRPERHYMRGGNTEGSRSLAAARARIATQR
ncbi:hypothetical protein [Paracraurococcus lichenis]|uniref:Uncharacterized protein n=1 Tax=Paracraurococcus lichenis TaxID=3064888 RepID=A0ABT9DSL8_9PROT|nr:hypothetical protein [Paracraurococcus sp. LOR1-02]MDO9706889.1 hypothetical protein [Paracraurococcus sp. LOR1-02]